MVKGGKDMFTLLDFVLFGMVIVALICVTVALFWAWGDKSQKAIVILIELLLVIGMVVGCGAYRTNTESGKRGLKSWKSETSGGIDRIVTVYDVKGKKLAEYTGRFDVEESSQEGVVKVKFDCKGKRHIIYAQTGTVLIDEN